MGKLKRNWFRKYCYFRHGHDMTSMAVKPFNFDDINRDGNQI